MQETRSDPIALRESGPHPGTRARPSCAIASRGSGPLQFASRCTVPNEIGAWIHETIGHTQELHMGSPAARGDAVYRRRSLLSDAAPARTRSGLTRHAGHKAREPTGAVEHRAAQRVRERQE
jgi:hypothetical protein